MARKKRSRGKRTLQAARPLFDVICVGSATEDVFAKSDADLVTIKSPQGNTELLAYPLGSKIRMKEIDFQIGGGGTNTAVSFARLGFKTAYLGCLGKDGRADDVLDCLRKERVSFIGYQEKVRTNFSVILDSMEEDRTILTYRDASNKLDFAKLDQRKISARLLFSSSLEEKGLASIVKIARLAKERGFAVAFNPGAYNAKAGMPGLLPIIPHLDIIILNKDEARTITAKDTIPEQMRAFCDAGISIVAITDGKRGSSILYDRTIYSTIPAKVKVVETTGAGDAFASAFCAGILMKGDPEFALRLGMIQAESVIQHRGAKNILLSRAAALRLVGKDKRKIERQAFTR